MGKQRDRRRGAAAFQAGKPGLSHPGAGGQFRLRQAKVTASPGVLPGEAVSVSVVAFQLSRVRVSVVGRPLAG